MGVRPGYKQTEVGVIPEDWEVKPLGQVAELTSSKRIFESDYVSFGVPFYRGKEISMLVEGRLIEEVRYISQERFASVKERFGIPTKGDILITAVGTLGNVYVVNFDEHFYFKDGNLIWIRNLKDAESDFLGVQLRSAKATILEGAIGTSQKALTIAGLQNLRIAFPSLAEQRAIAEALSDVDGLLAALDLLIAKKRDLKQAAIQQLLTARTRLPGFHGEWEVKQLGDLFSFTGGYSASRAQLSAEGHLYLHYGDIHGSSKTWIDVEADFQDIPKLNVPLKRVSHASLLDDGDVVFVDASEDEAGTSRHVVVVNKRAKAFIAGLHTIVAKSKTDELAHEYRRYCFQSAAIRQQFLFYAVGTKVSGISKTNIPKLTLPIPSIPEQTAIAEVLSDMDAELATLEQRRDKTRLLKQAMMQELLTGRTRLVTPGGRK